VTQDFRRWRLIDALHDHNVFPDVAMSFALVLSTRPHVVVYDPIHRPCAHDSPLLTAIIARPIRSAICGTIALPKHLSLSTRLGIP